MSKTPKSILILGLKACRPERVVTSSGKLVGSLFGVLTLGWRLMLPKGDT